MVHWSQIERATSPVAETKTCCIMDLPTNPITDPSLFESTLADKIAYGRMVSLNVTCPWGIATVYGILKRDPDGYYVVRSSDGMSNGLFKLGDVRRIGGICIWLNY